MTKLFKKSLALLLTLALCLSAMACCFIVSAEGETTPAGSISFVLADETKTEINHGDDVIIDVVAEWTGVAGAQFTVNGIPADAKVVATNTEDLVIDYDTAAATVKFVDGSNEPLDDGTLLSISFKATKAAGESYTFSISDAVFCDLDEEDVTVTSEATSFEVVEKQVEPEVPECEHEWKVVSATPATADASHAQTAPGSIDLACSKCGETDTQAVSYYRYYACASTNAAYESEIQFQLNARKVHLEREGAYEEAFIKITKEYATDDAPIVSYMYTSEAEETVKSGYDCYTWSIGIPAKELNDNVNANVFVKFNGAWYSGQPTNKSVVDYALSVIGGAKDTEKVLIANMLTYGAKAQVFLNYNTENLADANLGEYASYVTTTTPSIVDGYNNPYDTKNNEVILHKFNLDMASKVGLRTFFRTDFYKAGALDDLKVVASYETSAGTASTTYTSADYVLEGSYTDRYTFNYDVIPAKFMRSSVTLVAYNGETQVSATVSHSIESLVARLWNTISAEEQAVYAAMLNFGDAAAAHFVV